MADAPKQIGIIGNFLGEWALATRDERDQAVVYTRADLIDMDVLRRVEAALKDSFGISRAQERISKAALTDLRAMMEKLK